MNVEDRRRAARKFVEYWTFRRGSEKGEDQQFWNSLLGEVLGMEDVKSRVQYQVPVPMVGRVVPNAPQTTKFLDAWIPETRVLIEHKSRGVNLDAPQASHGGLTPYEQAVEYDNARPFDEKARWIVTCNFDGFRIYDRAKPLGSPMKVRLADLPKEAHRLAFLVNPKEKAIDRELEISVQAGRIVGEIYDALLKQMESVKCKMVNEGEPRRDTSTLHFTLSTLHSSDLAALNRLCVRLVFCLYAEDADIFPKDCFRRLTEATPAPFLRERLKKLFEILDTPPDKRDPYLEPELCVFPYTNGGLFKCCQCENIANSNSQLETGNISTFSHALDDIPPLTEEIRKLLIGASQFDWRDITPTIFGALFESTLNPVTRRAGGMVYTSVENIHKVIAPLFLSALEKRFEEIVANVKMLPIANANSQLGTGNTSTRITLTPRQRRELLALQAEMAALTFLDPACGSGNFLTESYLCLRRLENRIIAALQQGQGELDLGVSVKVSIAQFHGIEINDFAVSVAKTALWIAEAQMLRETAEILHREPDYLPLRDYANIVEGNALRMEWNRIGLPAPEVPIVVIEGEKNDARGITDSIAKGQGLDPSAASRVLRFAEAVKGAFAKKSFDYIMGNPPFSGARWMGKSQKEDMLSVFGKDWRGVGDLDYVTAWYKKAVDCMGGPRFVAATARTKPGPPRCAFVSTNSICQGGAVANLWKPLMAQGLEIDFAHRTFRWDNESFEKAHVHCVIVGFHAGGPRFVAATARTKPAPPEAADGTKPVPPKLIFDNGKAIPAAHINGYLMDAPDIFIESRTKPFCDVPEIGIGNKPIDGGHYLFTKDEMDEFLKKEPQSAQYFHPWYGAEEFINGKERFCLWLGECTPAELFNFPECMKRVQAVRDYRLSSKSEGTRKIADKPTRFHVENFPHGHYIVIPKVSSEKRQYVPIGFFTPDTFCSDLVFIIPDATLYHFGVLTSSVHMAWMRAVAGRLKSDYRYSANIVYNNFPWPDLCAAASLREKIETAAQSILDARAKNPGVTLAQMYGDKMYLFPDLRAAHAANDRAVLAAYGLAPDTPEPEIVAHLFRLYAEMTKKEGN